MTATNHALTGAFIGLAAGNPWLAIPAAFVSHFVCDTIPHFGQGKNNATFIRSKLFRYLLVVDASLCMLLVLSLWAFHPVHWLLASICAFVATSPDFAWISKFRRALARRNISNRDYFTRFASWIQWFQKPIGGVVEVAWLLGMIALISPFLH